jgi:hypothetical protein
MNKEQTLTLTYEQLINLVNEIRKPAPPTDQELAEIETAQAERLANANSVKEKMARKRQNQAVCTHRHNRKDGGASHVVLVHDNDYPGQSAGYVYCQACEVRVRPDTPLWRKLDPGAVFDDKLFVELVQDCSLTGAEILT